jgi:hypothetical protein
VVHAWPSTLVVDCTVEGLMRPELPAILKERRPRHLHQQ